MDEITEMYRKYHTRYDNAAYRRARQAVVEVRSTGLRTTGRATNHLLDIAEWFAGVGSHPACPPYRRQRLERAVRHMPALMRTVGPERWVRDVMPFLIKFV